MGDSSLLVVDDRRFDAHRARGYHPERAERLDAARSGLGAAVPAGLRVDLEARPASPSELARVHSPAYLERLERALATGWGHLDADTFFSPETRDATWLAAGGAAELARALVQDRARRGVALLRPPGHHAEPDDAMGFCLLNNVAIAAAAALDAGARRVAIVDWDVHHGNGTQAAFWTDPRVLFVSLHQWPFYPGTGSAEDIGENEGKGSTANVALPAGSGPEAYGMAFDRVVVPLLDRFGADIVLVSAGFDAHARDPLASMELDSQTYGAMATALVRHAERAGHGRVGLVLEGGYDLEALEGSVRAATEALLGTATELPEDAPREREVAAIERTLRSLG